MSCPFPPDSPFRCLTSDKRSARLPHLARAIHSAALSASAKMCELIQAAYAILVASTLFPDKFRSEWLSGFDDVAEIRIVEGLADLLFCFDMKVVRVHRVAKRLLVNLSKPFQQTRGILLLDTSFDIMLRHAIFDDSWSVRGINSPIFTPPPPAGRNDSWGGAAAGPARGDDPSLPFYANYPWLPSLRCTRRRSFHNQIEGWEI